MNKSDEKLIIKLNILLDDLPTFCKTFFRGIEPTTTLKTRIAYAFDLRTFFYFISTQIKAFADKNDNKDFIVTDLDLISPIDIEDYLSYLSLYYIPHYKEKDNMIKYTNGNNGKSRKLSSLRTFYKYYYKKQFIEKNPTLLVDLPKIHEKPITRLEVDEIVRLLNLVETGDSLSESQKKFHKKNKERDLALLTLLLGTGIRISECVQLNIKDFDFKINGFKITRKGGNQVVLYFSDEVAEAILSYLQIRNQIVPISGHEDALFLSIQRKRISVSTVQKLVKKYTKLIVPLKNISPHKLRSTYGTQLYRETGDIYLVADVLGHKDVNTTKKHYAAIDNEKRKQAANKVKLRDD
jgi:site-specific recombinase XerD